MPLSFDVRLAARQLRRNPGFTAVVLGTLGLCIGANTAIYSVLDAVLLHPLPYPEPERLAMVVSVYRPGAAQFTALEQSNALFQAIRDSAPGLETAAYAQANGANFNSGDRVDYIKQQRVSTGFFHVLGVAPAHGREFTRAEDLPHGRGVAILSDAFWHRAFRGSVAAVGRTVILRGEPFTVIGIMPRGFRTPAEQSFDPTLDGAVDIWTPLQPSSRGEGASRSYRVIARLKPGVSWAEASGQLQALSHVLPLLPGFASEHREMEEQIIPYQNALTAESRRELYLTWGAVLVVLLIGCINIAGLLLARSAARTREIATRIAVGGSRLAIVRQVLVESLLLAVAGWGLGLLLGAFVMDWLKKVGANAFEVVHPIELDGRVTLVTLAIAAITSLLFGLAPAIHASRLNVRSALMEGGRAIAGSRRNRLRSVLVTAQVALSMMLLVSAGLLVRTLGYLHGLTPGFEPANLLVAQSSLFDSRYTNGVAVRRLFHEALERIRAVPGVRSAAVALTLPYERPLRFSFTQLDGFEGEPRRMTAPTVYCTPGYFETMGIPVIQGREFRDSDGVRTNPVAVVSRSFAERYFEGADPIGRHLAIGNVTREIAGVVGDVSQHTDAEPFNAPIAASPTIYLPVDQVSDEFLNTSHVWFPPKWVIRSNASARLTARIQTAVSSVDPQLPITHFRTIDELESVNLTAQRYLAALFSMLAVLAAALAGIGLYGILSNVVTQRRYELGVRIAVGATAVHTVGDILKPALILVGSGVAAGALLAVGAGRLLESMLWGVSGADPITFLATAAALLLVAFIASAAPAWRISRLDPAETLRNDG